MNVVQKHLEGGVALHRQGKLNEAEEIYHSVLNLDPSNPQILYLLGDIATRRGNNGLAINLLTVSLQHDPTNKSALINLGCALKAEQFNDQAKGAWERALALGEDDEILSNIATLYADSFEAEKALELCNRSLALNPANPHAHWNRALALLTMQDWGEAWEEHEWRLQLTKLKGIGVRHYNLPRWQGEHSSKVIVHGEQGLGDEMMFLSCLPDVLARGCEVVVECEPRLIDIIERSFPGVRAYANEEALKAHETGFEYCIPMGSLPRLFRQRNDMFPAHRGYLKADPIRVAYWREVFDEYRLPSKPIIGLTWLGGTKGTRVQDRSLMPKNMPFLKDQTVVSLQYGEFAEETAHNNGILYFVESHGKDINEQAAMVMACDIVVTVCQTLVHLCGALGKECWVLTPKLSSWRYGRGSGMPWYPSVSLFRQHEAGDWSWPITEIGRRVEAWGK